VKFAICNETFQGWAIDRGFECAAECGYSGVEIAPFTLADRVTDITPAMRAEVRRSAESHGLEVVGLHWLLAKTEGFHLTSPDGQVRRRTAEYLAESARCCAEMGGRVLVFGSPKQRDVLPGVSRCQAMDYAVEVFSSVAPALEATDVVLAIEPLAPAETNFLLTAAETVELIERIGSPQIRLHLDCKAMSSETTPIPELIRRNAKVLAHFHANDPNLRGPGFGDLAFEPIFEALAEIDYRGWVSVEVFDYAPSPEVVARKSIEYMQECLERLLD
jgi:sugar phosphate isomerase/epimerase